MQKPISNVAIGTWPTPERILENFNLESFFLDQLVATKVINNHTDLNIRFQLALDSIKRAEAAGYFVDGVPDACKSKPIPPWCLVAGGIIVDGRMRLIDNLIANGALSAQTLRLWQKFIYEKHFAQCFPTLLRHFKVKGWTAEKSLAMLDHIFAVVAGVAYPIPGSDLDEYCRKHPESPVCKVAGMSFDTVHSRNLAMELTLITFLEQEHIIRPEQTRAIYDAYLNQVNPVSTVSDISICAGIIITEGLVLDKKIQLHIKNTLASTHVGYIDPDNPLADMCTRANPPKICHFMRGFPIMAALTAQLVKFKIWPLETAQKFWERVHYFFGLMI